MYRTLSPEELCALIDAHFSTLLLYARQWNAASAEDLVQDAFLQLVKRSHSEGKPEQPVAWLFQVVRNGAIDQARKEKTRQKHEESLARNPAALRFEVPHDSTIRADEIERLLDLLSEEQREIVVQRIWGGLTFDEIATIRNTSRTAVFRNYSGVLEKMRQYHENKEN